MKIIHKLSIILATVALTACAGTHDTDMSHKPEMMKKCEPEITAKLIHQTLSNEADIKAKTNAETVRMVSPGQPITKDYNPGRVTLIVDSQTKTILKAFCG